MDSRNNPTSTLAEHAQRLRERTDAICRFSGGIPTLEEGIQVFRRYCNEHDLWVHPPEGVFTFPDAYGDEHEVWFADERVAKFTYPDFFGLRVVYRSDESQKCLPCEYFERWVLHNEIFGDDVNIFGVWDTPEGMRTLLVQRAIKGKPSTDQEIQKFFVENGWLPFSTDDGKAWFDKERLLVVSDTHQGNLIETADGVLVPIDFRIQSVSGAILDAVRKMV